ncbi:phosphonoacetaldehyde hydrolase [Caulobacter segnis]
MTAFGLAEDVIAGLYDRSHTESRRVTQAPASSAIAAVVFDWGRDHDRLRLPRAARGPAGGLRRGGDSDSPKPRPRIDMGARPNATTCERCRPCRIAGLWTERHGAAWSEADVDRLHDAVEPKMRAAALDCARLIPGVAELVADLRAQGVKIGSTTGYTRLMMADILPLAAEQGYAPDVVVCAGETGPRPAVAADDVEGSGRAGRWPGPGLRQGRRRRRRDRGGAGGRPGRSACRPRATASAWTRRPRRSCPPPNAPRRIASSAKALQDAGAHYVVESVADLGPVLASLQARIQQGERP